MMRCASGQCRVRGTENNGVPLAVQILKSAMISSARFRIEISGRLVASTMEGELTSARAISDALALTTRKVRWLVIMHG